MRLENCGHCKEYEQVVSKPTASVNGLTFEINNESGLEVAKWNIDCILEGNKTKKCDYLFVVRELSSCYWVELTDEGFDKACEQIYTTITKIADAINYKTHYARIVLGRFKEERNRIDNLRYTNHKKLVNKIGRHNLKHKTKLLTDII
jgi:hypothetical protein